MFKVCVLSIVVVIQLQVNSAQVRFQNFTGSAVVITNEARRLSVPPGELLVNLEAGEWGSDTVPTLEVQDRDEMLIARFSQDENSTGVLDVALEGNLLDVYFRGFITGLTIFGFSWMVSAVREGLTIKISRCD